MEQLSRKKLSQEVLDRLIAAIERREYSPGSQLPSERELMTHYGVGRPAIREALQALQQMNLIRIIHGERARVVLPTPTGIIDHISGAMIQLLVTNPRGLDDLKQARLLFEVGLARIAAAQGTRESIERLRLALAACDAAKGERTRFIKADMAFHHAIAETSGNGLIAAISKGMLTWIMRFRRELVSVRGAERLTLEEHERIYRAIADGDADAAAKAMTDHLTRANSLYSVLMESQTTTPKPDAPRTARTTRPARASSQMPKAPAAEG